MDTLEIIVGRIEKRIKALGTNASAASKAAGLSSSAIYNMQRGAMGKIPVKGVNASTISALAPALRTTVAWLTEGKGPEEVEGSSDIAPTSTKIIRPAGPESSEVEKIGEGWPDTGTEWMDVRGVTVGGDDSFFYFGDVIDRVRRPPGIRKAENVAALNVAGESMFPRFKPGELIYVQQRLAVPGDDVVIELYPEHEGDAPKSFLKELMRKTGGRLYCRQHNPPSEIEFDMGEVRALWRVLTLRDLLG